MMSLRSVLLIITNSFILINSFPNNFTYDTYFCKIGCKCVCDEAAYCATVCNNLTIKKNLLYDETNFDHHMKDLGINNQNWTELNTPIAENQLDVLDLSNNSINYIRSGVFMNQFKLKVLILNDNNLTNIDVDAFKVFTLK